MPQTMASLDPILKEVYSGSLNEMLNNDTLSYNRIKSTSDGTGTMPYGGKYVVFPLHVSRNSGIGARNEGEVLPNAGKQGTVRAQLNLKYQYGAIELNGQTFELATKDYQSFADAMEMEVSGIKADLTKDRNRQYFGNGNGRVATVTAAISGQNITVDSVQHIQDDELLDAYTSGGALRQANLRVTVVNEATNVITVTGTGTGIANTDILVRQGSYNREWTGLAAIVDDTSTLYGINPATQRTWKAEKNIQGGVSTALSEATFMRMADRLRRNGEKATAILTTLGVQRAYWLLLTQQRRFTDTKEFKGGYTGLEFNAGSSGSLPMIADIDAPASTAYFVNEKQIKMYRPHEFKFMDRDGSMWKQKVDASGRYDAYVASLYEYSEIGTRKRNSHGVITNITEDIA
jgi:hypothetical protein